MCARGWELCSLRAERNELHAANYHANPYYREVRDHVLLYVLDLSIFNFTLQYICVFEEL